MNVGRMCTVIRLAWYRCFVHKNAIASFIRERQKRLHSRVCLVESVTLKTKQANTDGQKVYYAFSRRFRAVAEHKVRHAFQIVWLFQQFAVEKRLLQAMCKEFSRSARHLLIVLPSAGVFHWERDGVQEEELHSALAEMEAVKELVDHAETNKVDLEHGMAGWDVLVNHPHLKVWYRLRMSDNVIEYRVFGTFKDITPRAFYNTQMDLKFSCGWNSQTISIKVVDIDKGRNSEVIHWCYKYPFPMYPREYCYVRRSMVYLEKNCIVIRARTVPHHKCPEGDDIVRVNDYQSKLVIEPETTFDENGFSFYLTYFDDPQTQMPRSAYRLVASIGVPEFVERLHKATKVMQERMKKGYIPNILVYSES